MIDIELELLVFDSNSYNHFTVFKQIINIK